MSEPSFIPLDNITESLLMNEAALRCWIANDERGDHLPDYPRVDADRIALDLVEQIDSFRIEWTITGRDGGYEAYVRRGTDTTLLDLHCTGWPIHADDLHSNGGAIIRLLMTVLAHVQR